jgi:hypothetical protein
MGTKEIERAAYMAAYRILTADTSAPELACASARRSRAIDTIAGIIRDTFEAHGAVAEAPAWNEGAAEPRVAAAAVGRGGRVLVELKQRPPARRGETLAGVADGTV